MEATSHTKLQSVMSSVMYSVCLANMTSFLLTPICCHIGSVQFVVYTADEDLQGRSIQFLRGVVWLIFASVFVSSHSCHWMH